MLYNVNVVLRFSSKMLHEIIPYKVEVIPVAESVVRTGNYHHIETFVVAYQRVSESHRAGRMHIVVNLPGNQQQSALKVGGEFGCCGNLAFECLTAVFPDDFLYTVEGFSPPLGVDIIVVIARCPHCHLVEPGMAEQCGDCHKTAS